MASKLCALIVHNSLINFRSLVRSLLETDGGVFAIPPPPFKNEIQDKFDTSKIGVRISFLTTFASMNTVVVSKGISVDTIVTNLEIIKLSMWLLIIVAKLSKEDFFFQDFSFIGAISKIMTGILSVPI